MWKEFRDFIMTGNVIDLAVAVLLAGAVGMVVNGFVSDIMMPIVGYFTGGVDFTDLFYALDGKTYESLAVATEAGAAVIAYGKWINSIINLIIVGFVLFVIVKTYARVRAKKEKAPTPPSGPSEIDLLKEIRDALKK